MLALYPFVDLVVVFEEDTPIGLIEAIRPDVLVKGGDYTPETIVGRELVESYGGAGCDLPEVGWAEYDGHWCAGWGAGRGCQGRRGLAGMSVGSRSARLSWRSRRTGTRRSPKSAESTSFRGAKGDNGRQTSGSEASIMSPFAPRKDFSFPMDLSLRERRQWAAPIAWHISPPFPIPCRSALLSAVARKNVKF